jgi:hypothetical protein
LPSYGENFCRLFVLYDNARKKSNKRWIANGKDFTLSEDQVEYYSDGYPYEKVEEDSSFSKKKSKRGKSDAVTVHNTAVEKVNKR